MSLTHSVRRVKLQGLNMNEVELVRCTLIVRWYCDLLIVGIGILEDEFTILDCIQHHRMS